MVMLRPAGKAYKVAQSVLKNKGINVPKPREYEKLKISMPYLQH